MAHYFYPKHLLFLVCTLLSFFFFLLSCPETNKQVIVWIHGGAFIFGGIGVYNPEYIMEENVVLVTIQYRLNIKLRFRSHPSTFDVCKPGIDHSQCRNWKFLWRRHGVGDVCTDTNKNYDDADYSYLNHL